MSHRSRKHRKRFACGHRGFGQYCHRCARQRAKKQAQFLSRQSKRQRWQASFLNDQIELQNLPKSVVKKSRTVLDALSQGKRYWQLSGKRLHDMHNIIRIPVTRRYRLLCRDDGNIVTPLEVISHETYNPLAAKPQRLWQRLSRRNTSED